MPVLTKFAWKPIAHGAGKARAVIESNIAKAENAAAEARAMLAEYEKKLAGASDEVRAMLEEARRDAEHTKQEIVAEARVAPSRSRTGRCAISTRRRTRRSRSWPSEAPDLAVDLAGKIIVRAS